MIIKRHTSIILSEEDKAKISAFSSLLTEIQSEVVGESNSDDITIDGIIEGIDKAIENLNEFVEE